MVRRLPIVVNTDAINALYADQTFINLVDAKVNLKINDLVANSVIANAQSVSKSYIQETRPIENGPWYWWQTNASGQIVNLIINDGNNNG